jgi:hypothetical protein
MATDHFRAHEGSLAGTPAAGSGTAPVPEDAARAGDPSESTNRPDAAVTPALTAYPGTEVALRSTLATAPLDAPSFARPLARCSLAACRGMCCYDGVYVNDEEAEVIEEVVRQEAGFFSKLGLNLAERVIVDGEWEGQVSGKKTAVVPHAFASEVPHFPEHFKDTACVFHLDDGRCGLQVLSEARGHHPWYYKPFTCWLHPISLAPGEEGQGAAILVESATSDPYRVPGYDGFVEQTFCGRTAPCGRPAREVLAEEIALLGAITGRDLAAELQASAGSSREAVDGAPDHD